MTTIGSIGSTDHGITADATAFEASLGTTADAVARFTPPPPTCVRCGSPAVAVCSCPHRHAACPNGHHWHLNAAGQSVVDKAGPQPCSTRTPADTAKRVVRDVLNALGGRRVVRLVTGTKDPVAHAELRAGLVEVVRRAIDAGRGE